MAKFRVIKGCRSAQGDDHFLCAVLVPAACKAKVEKALESAAPAAAALAYCYAPLEDFEDADSAGHQGRALGAMLHRAVMERH